MLCECVLYEPQSAALVEKKGLPITWAGESWFATCAHTFEASFCPPRQGYVRGAIRFQGLLGTPRSSRVTLDASTKGKLLSQSGTRLTFLANIDFGNIIVTSFVNSIYADVMKYPLRKVLNVEKRFEKAKNVGRAEDQRSDGLGAYAVVAPTDLTVANCLVDKTKYATLRAQRLFFQKRMLEMAREDGDNDGWSFVSQTTMLGLNDAEQLDVYARDVEWSKVKQYRTVTETRFTCEEVFDFLLLHFDNDYVDEQFRKSIPEEQVKSMVSQKYFFPWKRINENGVTALLLR